MSLEWFRNRSPKSYFKYYNTHSARATSVNIILYYGIYIIIEVRKI